MKLLREMRRYVEAATFRAHLAGPCWADRRDANDNDQYPSFVVQYGARYHGNRGIMGIEGFLLSLS